MEPKIILHIGAELKQKLDILTTNYKDIEVAGYITTDVRNGEIYLCDILIPSQQVSKTSVEIKPSDQIDLLKRYGDKVKKIGMHFHSHNDMGAWYSGTDLRCMDDIMLYKDFFMFMVGSKGNYLIKICQKKPFKFETTNCELNVKTVGIDIMRNFVDKIIKKNSSNYTQSDYFIGDKKADEENYQKYKESDKCIDDEEDNEEDIEDLIKDYTN